MIETGPPALKTQPTVAHQLKNWFIAGVFTIIPVFMAIWAVQILLGLAEDFFGDIVRKSVLFFIDEKGAYGALVSPAAQIISLGIALTFVVAVGWLSAFLVVRRMIAQGEVWISKIPFVKFFYTTPKEVISLMTKDKANTFRRVVLVEYPREGTLSIAFATAETVDEQGAPMVAVFMPTTPLPTQGFLMYIPPVRLRDTDLTFEEAFRVLMSGGILTPSVIASRPYEFGALKNAPASPDTIELVKRALP